VAGARGVRVVHDEKAMLAGRLERGITVGLHWMKIKTNSNTCDKTVRPAFLKDTGPVHPKESYSCELWVQADEIC
jgi:hypothetical protein